jgi:hypothetical protein
MKTGPDSTATLMAVDAWQALSRPVSSASN